MSFTKYDPGDFSPGQITFTHFLFKVKTIDSEDFTVQGGDLPGLLVKTLELSLLLTSFCLEHGIQVCTFNFIPDFS